MLIVLGVAFFAAALSIFASTFLMAEISKTTTVGAGASLKVARGDATGEVVQMANPDFGVSEVAVPLAASDARTARAVVPSPLFTSAAPAAGHAAPSYVAGTSAG